MRSGSTIGSRVWMRTRRTCGMAARPSHNKASRRSLSVSGSPPLRITSPMLASARIASIAGAKPAREAFTSS